MTVVETLDVPGDPQRGPRGRRRRREPAARPRARAVPTPVRRAGAARGRRRHQRPGARPAGARARASPTDEVYRAPAPLDLVGPVGARRDRAGRTCTTPASCPQTHPRAARRRTAHRPTSSPRCAARRRAAAPPLRLVRDQRAGVHRAGGRRPGGAGASSSRSTAPAASRRSSTPWSTRPAAGKQVLVVVEIKARFDEQANIRWARKLEQAGCHVVYGLVGLKTHCKLALVVRTEDDGRLRRYVHVGTGNYNPKTARVYEDLGLLTSDPARRRRRRRPVQPPLRLHPPPRLRHAARRAGHAASRAARPHLRARPGGPRRASARGISIKVNSLVDETLIDALYDASRAGVPIDLLVRGMCSAAARAYPGCPRRSGCAACSAASSSTRGSTGSGPAASADVLIGSADVMDRNLDRRVEALVRVTRPRRAGSELDDLLELAWSRRRRPLVARPRRHLAADPAPARAGRPTSRSLIDRRAGDRMERLSRAAAIEAAGGCAVARRPRAGHRGGAGPPAEVRRLVAAQGQARPRRAPAARRAARDRGGDRVRRPARATARRRCATPRRPGPSGCGTGRCAAARRSLRGQPRGRRAVVGAGRAALRQARARPGPAGSSSSSRPTPARTRALRRRTACRGRRPAGLARARTRDRPLDARPGAGPAALVAACCGVRRARAGHRRRAALPARPWRRSPPRRAGRRRRAAARATAGLRGATRSAARRGRRPAGRLGGRRPAAWRGAASARCIAGPGGRRLAGDLGRRAAGRPTVWSSSARAALVVAAPRRPVAGPLLVAVERLPAPEPGGEGRNPGAGGDGSGVPMRTDGGMSARTL